MTTSVCGECGERNDAGVAFCASCHAYLHWDSADAGPKAPPDSAAERVPPPDGPGVPAEQAIETRVLPRLDELHHPEPETPPPAADTAQHRFHLTADLDTVSVPPTGESVTVTVEIANTSNIVDGYQLEVPGAPEWLSVQSGQLQLLPGTHEAQPIRLRIASPTLVPAQRFPVALRVRSMVQPTAYSDLLLEITVPVVAAPVQLRPEPQLVRVRDQDTARCVLVVDNARSNRPLRLGFVGSDPELAVRFTFEPQVLDVAPGASGTVNVTLVSPGPEPGRESSRTLTVTADDGEHRVDTSLTLQQSTSAEDPPVTIEVVPSLVRIHDADAANVRVILDNRQGRSSVRLWLGGSDPEQAVHFTYTPPVTDVPAGRVVAVDLRLDSPRPGPGQEQNRPFTVTAGDGRATVQAHASLLQVTSRAAIETLTIGLDPSVLNLASRRRGWLTAVLDNRAGSQPANVTLRGDDPRNALHFDFSPAVVNVAPGGTARTRIGVRAPRPHSGGEVTLPFDVMASDGRSEIRTSGSVIQAAADRRPILRVLLTLLGGLAIILGTLLPLRAGDPTRAADLNADVLGDVFGFGVDLGGVERLLTVGLLITALGVLVMVGLTGAKGRLTRAAAVFCLLLVIGLLVAIGVIGFSPVPGSGAVLMILGCITGYVGGKLVRR